jgi:hypothetical protein
MKTTKLLIIALVMGAFTATSAFAGTRHWNHNRHYRNHSGVHFSIGLGYPYGYGYGYPYYGTYPYGYGYGYYAPRTTVYATSGYTDDATVAAVQRRLARGGYYHGSIDGVIGPATRVAVRAFERNNGLPADGVIDRQLLRTMGLA